MSDRHEPPPTSDGGEALPSAAAEGPAVADDPSPPDQPARCDTFPDSVDDPDPINGIPH
ncbi:MAG TPA: hypothetical protein VGL21_09475 [Jatrophihabitantaceae bacterium]